MTAARPSPFTTVIVQHLTDPGIDVRIEQNADLGIALFSAHLNNSGELVSAVSAMPVEVHTFADSVIESALEEASLVMLDCNLSIATLCQIAAMAQARKIPTFIAAVSEEKALRLVPVARYATAVFMNVREAGYLFTRRLSHAPSYPALSEELGCDIVVTLDAEGVVVVNNKREVLLPARPIKHGNGHFLGAGDALMARAIASYALEGAGLVDAVRAGMAHAAELIERNNCNFGQDHAVEKILTGTVEKANRDQLTGLLNRRGIEHRMAVETARVAGGAGPLTVLMLDIDHFKSVNDTYGHDVGDKVIQAVGEALTNALRGHDAIGRWGGEEFVCLLSVDLQMAVIIAERARQVISSTIRSPRVITASIGVAEYQPLAEDLVGTLKRADEAMYAAKKGGRNRVEMATLLNAPCRLRA